MNRERLSFWLTAIGAPLILLVLLIIGWQWIAINLRSILPPLPDVLADFFSRPLFYWSNLLVTLHAAVIGLALGGGVALFLAMLIVHYNFLAAAIMPAALMLNVTPIVAISPALIVAFGFNATPHIIVAALSAFFPLLINAIAGLRAIDKQALDVFQAMSASRSDIFLRLRLPSSLPYLFTGARLSATAAMVGSVVSEFTGTSKGLGATIVMATTYLNLSQMWVAIFVSIITSLILVGIVGLVEKLVIRW